MCSTSQSHIENTKEYKWLSLSVTPNFADRKERINPEAFQNSSPTVPATKQKLKFEIKSILEIAFFSAQY